MKIVRPRVPNNMILPKASIFGHFDAKGCADTQYLPCAVLKKIVSKCLEPGSVVVCAVTTKQRRRRPGDAWPILSTG